MNYYCKQQRGSQKRIEQKGENFKKGNSTRVCQIKVKNEDKSILWYCSKDDGYFNGLG